MMQNNPKISDITVGFFDSGLGGAEVKRIFESYYPELQTLLFMDREHAPYGSRTTDSIRSLTYDGVQSLFDQGADVVIIACNTASVHALRWLQTESMVGRKILGVTVPGAEAIIEGGYHHIGVLATEATVRIRAYRDRVHILDKDVRVEEVAAPGLVPLIEQGIIHGEEIDDLLRVYLSSLSPDIEALVLGCTHYPLIQGSIEQVWREIHQKNPPDIINPGEEAARKFRGWRERRREIISSF